MFASPARMVSTATAKPQLMPAMAPKAFMRFHQIDSTSTGKKVEPLSASDHSSRRSGSVGRDQRDDAAEHRGAGDGEAPHVHAAGARQRLPRHAVDDILGDDVAERAGGGAGADERGGDDAGRGEIDEHARQPRRHRQAEQHAVAQEAEARERQRRCRRIDGDEAELDEVAHPVGQRRRRRRP